MFGNESYFINGLFWPFFHHIWIIFHKTEVLTVILRGFTGLSYDWFKTYDTKQKYFHFSFLLFCTKTDICVFCVFCIFVITFVSIKIQTCYASQNDHLNLLFVKYNHVAGIKMAKYGPKMTIYQLLLFLSCRTCSGPHVTSEIAITFDSIKTLTC